MINPPNDSLSAATPLETRKSPPDLKSVETGGGEAGPAAAAPAAPATDLAALRAARRAAAAAEAAKSAPAKPAAAKPAPAPTPAPEPTAPPAAEAPLDLKPAYARPRHWVAIASFLLLVVLPVIATLAYLYVRAADQYHSNTAFSIRSEGISSAAAGLLGAITQVGGGTSSDANILSEYIRSQKIVENIDAKIDLRSIYNKPDNDPVFTLGQNTTIEQMLGYWSKMVDVSYDSTSGIIHVRTNAFTPQDAQKIGQAILAESSALVNKLSEQARADAIRFASAEVTETEDKLRDVRQRMADFQHKHGLVDPSGAVAGQAGLLNSLQNQLAQAMVGKDELMTYAGPDDQRVLQANRRIDAIRARIDQERNSLDVEGMEGTLPEVVGAYEALRLDLEFATKAYTRALAGLTAAQAEARRQSRYLATHIQPTLAESSLYPRRPLIAGLTALFLLLGWSVLMLGYYNIRDNR